MKFAQRHSRRHRPPLRRGLPSEREPDEDDRVGARELPDEARELDDDDNDDEAAAAAARATATARASHSQQLVHQTIITLVPSV